MDAPHHRKIDLQSPSDLQHLQRTIQQTARSKLDLAIPTPLSDPFKQKVDELVTDYIQRTLTLALPSLSINGLDASPALLYPSSNPPDPNNPHSEPENYEPYDPRLASKLRNLYALLETESTRVAELRREAPPAAARAYAERLGAEMGGEEGMESEGRVGEEGELVGGVGAGVEGIWERGREGLGGLEGVTGVLAKLERAEKVVGVLERL